MDPNTTPPQVPQPNPLTPPKPDSNGFDQPAAPAQSVPPAPLSQPLADAGQSAPAPSMTEMPLAQPVTPNPPVQPSQPMQPTQPPTPGLFQPVSPASPSVDAQPQPLGTPPGMIQPLSSVAPSATQNQSKTKLIIGIVIAVIILAVGAAFALSPKKNSSSQTKNTTPSSNSSSTKANALTAEYLSEFSAVCSGSTISNAADYTGAAPHPIALYESGLIDANDYTSSSVYLSDQTWSAKTEDFAKTQLVGCFSKKSTTATGKKCELKDSNENVVSLEQYNVVYSLKIYEAKTGKKLGEKEVSGPTTSCPFFASYNKEDPKLYGDPDKGATTEAVKEFVTK